MDTNEGKPTETINNPITDGGQPSSDGGTVSNAPTQRPWLEQVKADLRESEAIKDITDVNHLTESYITISGEVNNLRGNLESSVKIPGADASAEEKEAFYRKLGKPEKAEDYEFPETDVVKNDPATVEWARGVFSKANLTKEQASIVRDEWNQYVIQVNQKVENEMKEARSKKLSDDLQVLKDKWGNKFEERAVIARKTMDTAVANSEELRTWLKDKNLDNDPVLTQLFFDISPAFVDDKAITPSPSVTQEAKGTGMNYPDM